MIDEKLNEDSEETSPIDSTDIPSEETVESGEMELKEGEVSYASQMNARTTIIDILTRVEQRQAYSDRLLEREIEELNEADRALVTEVVNGVLRWQARLDWYLQHLYVGEYDNLIPEVKNNLRSSVYQLMYLDRIPPYAVLNEAVEIAKKKYNQRTANLVNAILRNFLRQQKKLEYLEIELDVLERMTVRLSHPKWLLQRWIEFWGVDEVTRLCECNNTRPRLSVRVNLIQTSPEEVIKKLDEYGIQYEVHSDFPNFIWIDNFSEFRKSDLLKTGMVSVQDVSTGLPVLVLDPQPGEQVLDMCAAPGGKSGYIAERMKNEGHLIAMDRYINRVVMLRDNLRRFGVSIANYICADGEFLPFKGKFDHILLDAPCTGFGVLSKRVDLKWKRSEQDIFNMQAIQLKLLDSAAAALKTEGVLVYSTCTIEPEENERVVEKFLEKHPEFELENLKGLVPDAYLWEKNYIRTFPHKHHMDGTFVARLKKHSD